MTTINNTTLRGTGQNEQLKGGDGNDTIYGGGGADTLEGAAGDDLLTSSEYFDPVARVWRMDNLGDTLDGGDGNDTLYGGSRNDMLLGGTGDDLFYGGGGADTIDGGDGNDMLNSGKVYDPVLGVYLADTDGDSLAGGAGNDTLYGSSGNDMLLGGDGDDSLDGGDGDDFLDGGNGANILRGGFGNDTYHIHSTADTVSDLGGNDKGVIFVDWYRPSAQVANWTWAPGVQQLPYWIAALAEPSSMLTFEKKVFTYYFADVPPTYFNDEDKAGFTPFSAEQRAFVKKVMQYISTVLNVEFREAASAGNGENIVMANNLQVRSAAYSVRGALLLDISEDNQYPNQHPAENNFGVLTLLHELGHSMGLKHPFDRGRAGNDFYLSGAEDKSAWTRMSYTISSADFKLAYGVLDLAALQYLYGPSTQLNAGDTTYKLSATAPNLIGDGGGVDTIDAGGLATGIVLDLRPGYWGYVGSKAKTITAAGQITINFGTDIEIAIGGVGNDTITGNDRNNTLSGGAGDDRLRGGGGSDTIDGGAGFDIVSFAGRKADYAITYAGATGRATVALNGSDVDQLTGVERISFDDRVLAFDIDGNAGKVYRLYQAAFNRTPDAEGLGFWIDARDKGLTMEEMARQFIGGDEFTRLYGVRLSNAAFLSNVYENILHRLPDQSGYDWWLDELDHGLSRARVLADFAEGPENLAQVIGSIQNGIEFVKYG